MKKLKNEEFDLEFQYRRFLQLVNLHEENMHPLQKIQLRQAFYGACGQMLVLFRDHIGALEENEAVSVMNDLFNQVGNYWNKEGKRQN